MNTYLPRVADKLLERKLKTSGGVLIQGPKWCGKTTTAAHLAKSCVYFDDPRNMDQYFSLLKTFPEKLLDGNNPRLIDEWQLAPKLWDYARFEIDHRNERGLFIFTGSAVPADLSSLHHTGTGRFSFLTMRPMSLYESGDSNGQISLTELFQNNNNHSKVFSEAKTAILDLAWMICRGGWPATLNLEKELALDLARQYVDAVVYSDLNRVDGVSRDIHKTTRLLRSLARNICSQAPIATITKDFAIGDYDQITRQTISNYLDALKKIFVIEDSAAWNPNLRSKTSMRSADTRYFCDPSLATAALGLGPQDLLQDLNTMGLMFENLCIRDLRVYAEALDGNIFHYRDSDDLECDAVIHLRNGKYGLIEVKLGGEKAIELGANNLKLLAANIDTTKMPTPSFMMVLTGVGKYAYRREDGVLVVPITTLKD